MPMLAFDFQLIDSSSRRRPSMLMSSFALPPSRHFSTDCRRCHYYDDI
jgi:hypothetical protein